MATGFIEAKTSEGAGAARASGGVHVTERYGERQVFEPKLIVMLGCLCIAALAIAGFGRWTGVGVQKLPQSAAVETRHLKFIDAGKGAIDVIDADQDVRISQVTPGEGGFLRTVMRGLAHDRMARGGDSSTPFTLTLREDGRLTIMDPMTRREIILDSFGKPNRDNFARFLKRATAEKTSDASTAGAALSTKGEKQ
jgi:putative photosynthetic complex assembly protein